MSERPELELASGLAEALRPLVAELVRAELERIGAETSRASWLTVEEAAEQRRTTPGAIRARCERGQLPGAVRDGRRWLIPSLDAGPDPANVRGDNHKWGERRANGPAPGTRDRSSHAR
jgi:hypothetical protein